MMKIWKTLAEVDRGDCLLFKQKCAKKINFPPSRLHVMRLYVFFLLTPSFITEACPSWRNERDVTALINLIVSLYLLFMPKSHHRRKGHQQNTAFRV